AEGGHRPADGMSEGGGGRRCVSRQWLLRLGRRKKRGQLEIREVNRHKCGTPFASTDCLRRGIAFCESRAYLCYSTQPYSTGLGKRTAKNLCNRQLILISKRHSP